MYTDVACFRLRVQTMTLLCGMLFTLRVGERPSNTMGVACAWAQAGGGHGFTCATRRPALGVQVHAFARARGRTDMCMHT